MKKVPDVAHFPIREEEAIRIRLQVVREMHIKGEEEGMTLFV